MLFEKPLNQITANDVLQLKENAVPESRTLEYKRELPPVEKEAKKEFLRDVSAFANAAGGILVFGVATRQGAAGAGIPERIDGLSNFDYDKAVRRLGDSMRTGLRPGLSWAEWRQLEVPGAAGPVLLLRVPQSVVGPHMVTFENAHELWRRGPANKYEPDVQELRQMFLAGATWLDQVQHFRQDRIESVRAGLYRNLNTKSSIFVHVLPVGRLDGLIDLRPHETKFREFAPLTHDGWSHKFNAFGHMTHDTRSDSVVSYSQWFRNGGVEGYSAQYRYQSPAAFGPVLEGFRAPLLSKDLPSFVRPALRLMQETLGFDPPFAVGLATYGLAGSSIYLGPEIYGGKQIENDVGMLPPIIVNEAAAPELEEDLLSLLDVVWQSAGYSGVPRKKTPAAS